MSKVKEPDKKNNSNKSVSFDDNTIIHQFIDSKNEKEVIRSREDDIKSRGENNYVHDHDGKKVNLKDASIWFSHDGNYIQPADYDTCEICEIFTNFKSCSIQ